MAFSVPLSETSNSLASLPGTTKEQLEAEDWGGGGWLESFLHSLPPPHVCTKQSKDSDRLIHLNLAELDVLLQKHDSKQCANGISTFRKHQRPLHTE